MSKDNLTTTTKFSHKFGFPNADEFEFAIKFIGTAYRQFIMRQITDTELISHFAHLNQDLQQSVLDVIGVRRTEVEEFLVCEFNARDTKLLVSFDWDVKWIMGTSSMATMRQQLATLVLNCRRSGGGGSATGKETVSVEMRQPQVREMIRMLEACEKEMTLVEETGEDAGVTGDSVVVPVAPSPAANVVVLQS